MAGLTLLETAAASVPTPATGKDTMFFDSADGLFKYKDDAGAVNALAGAPADVQYVTLATNATLTNERVLTAGAGITVTDGGAGSTVTIASTIAQNSQSADYTAVLGDANKHLLHPTADNNPRTFTIPANGSVAYPIGTTLMFVNQINTLTIAIASDSLVWAQDGSTGSRTLTGVGMATALKIESAVWMINGSATLT